MQQKEIRTFL